jgi:glucosamine--fructose-6-phosphate aminotransferase (isomerizing)
MNLREFKYNRFALCREMMETIKLVEGFETKKSERFIAPLRQMKNILITGEGSSRIFPGKNFKDKSLKSGVGYGVVVEGASEASGYQLDKHCVFGVSNSGKTKELINLFKRLIEINHKYMYGITATGGSPVTQLAIGSVVLACGMEEAVAATKSVVEQALFFESLYFNYTDRPMPSLKTLAEDIHSALEISIDAWVVNAISTAPVIYFAGRNNGVAEELALKTNEIARKKSVFLEGTYALHGIEEVMQKGEVLLIIGPFEQEEQKFYDVIQKGAGVPVIAISSRKTIFPTILIPKNLEYQNFIELAAGWNLLVEIGINLGIDLDKPERARKIGNEI